MNTIYHAKSLHDLTIDKASIKYIHILDLLASDDIPMIYMYRILEYIYFRMVEDETESINIDNKICLLKKLYSIDMLYFNYFYQYKDHFLIKALYAEEELIEKIKNPCITFINIHLINMYSTHVINSVTFNLKYLVSCYKRLNLKNSPLNLKKIKLLIDHPNINFKKYNKIPYGTCVKYIVKPFCEYSHVIKNVAIHPISQRHCGTE